MLPGLFPRHTGSHLYLPRENPPCPETHHHQIKQETHQRPGAVAHACNPSILGSEAGGSPEVRRIPAWSTWQNSISTKNTKTSQVWWWAPVIPATWEGKAGESLESRRRRLQ
uniref:Uncharacterized protein n=1 Tax=Theropithecus gelada TaxID=9565 RepID=A0A8D2G804_THEGE